MTALGVAFGALGIVLAVSGVLKLANPAPTTAMLRELSPDTRRLPVWPIGIGELSLGLAAVVVGGRVVAALVAACYATFAAVSIALVRRGSTVPCGCLGSRSVPTSPVHVGVNLGATAVAALAAVVGIPGVFPGRFTAGWAVHVVLACLVAGILVALLRSGSARPAVALEPDGFPPVGSGPAADPVTGSGAPASGRPAGSSPAAPEDPLSPGTAGSHDFEGTTPDGAAVLVAVNGAEHRTLLGFLGAGCGTCAPFWRGLGTGHAAELAVHHTELVLVTRGPEQVDPEAVRATAPAGQLTVMSSQAWEQYGVPWIPYFILVEGRSSRVLAEGTARSWDQLLAMIRGEDGPPGPQPGPVAPEIPRSWRRPGIEARSGAGGRSLIAQEPFGADEVVIVLAGLHVPGPQAQALVARNAAAPRPIPLGDDTYLLQAPDDEAVYASHSCDPTLWLVDSFSLRTRREISAGDELTIDYATVIADPGWQMACRCGAATCRGTIYGDDWKLSSLQIRYAGHFAPGIAGAGGRGDGGRLTFSS